LAWLCLQCDILNLVGKSEKPANLAGFFAFESTAFWLAFARRRLVFGSRCSLVFGSSFARLLLVSRSFLACSSLNYFEIKWIDKSYFEFI
jgi:hypothetical protein